MNNKTEEYINTEIKRATRKIKRLQVRVDDLEKLKAENKLSVWGYRDLGQFKESIDCNMDLLDILEDIKRMEGASAQE